MLFQLLCFQIIAFVLCGAPMHFSAIFPSQIRAIKSFKYSWLIKTETFTDAERGTVDPERNANTFNYLKSSGLG